MFYLLINQWLFMLVIQHSSTYTQLSCHCCFCDLFCFNSICLHKAISNVRSFFLLLPTLLLISQLIHMFPVTHAANAIPLYYCFFLLLFFLTKCIWWYLKYLHLSRLVGRKHPRF